MATAAIARFRKYLRIRTVQPDPDYDGAVAFLRDQAAEIGLECVVIEVHPGKPVVLMTWQGSDSSCSSIMLNSHMDVVPVYPEKWTHDPFEAVKDQDGNIYARGAQDMKNVGAQYLEAIRVLREAGFKPKRTIHVTFVPDEEIGGHYGMELFVETDTFQNMNVGFALDEGVANPGEMYYVSYGERVSWWIKFVATGNPGHGSMYVKNTAAEKIQKIINLGLEFREQQQAKLNSNPELKPGDITSLNMTMVSGGVQANVIPAEMSVTFDCRVSPKDSLSMEEFELKLESWIQEAGPGVRKEFVSKDKLTRMESLTEDNPWWGAFSNAMNDMKCKMMCVLLPGGTDARYVRAKGIPAIGFSPMNHTPILLHNHNEYINEVVFHHGIRIYAKIIENITAV